MSTSWLALEGKTIIVTGGASGIGKAVVEELLADGANVVVCDMNPNTPVFENGKEGQMTYVVTNVTSAESVNAMVEKTLATYGRIDAIVNNAGINIPRLLVDEGNRYELDEAVWDKVMNVNLKGVFLCLPRAPKMRGCIGVLPRVCRRSHHHPIATPHHQTSHSEEACC